MPRASAIALILALLLPPHTMAAERDECVVLLHGLARTSAHMKPVADALAAEGYEVLNLDYPSTEFTLEELLPKLEAQIAPCLKAGRVHFVGYSMGAVLARALINRQRPARLSRVVQLAPPNHGSEVADSWKGNWFYRKYFGPAGAELGTADDAHLAALMGPVDYELGVIAGDFTVDPVSSLLLPGEDDGKVTVASTRAEGMKEHKVVSASHTFFPSNRDVIESTLRFIAHGRFGG